MPSPRNRRSELVSGLGEPAKPLGPRGGEYSEVWIGERRLICVVCGEDSFGYRQVLLNTQAMTYFGLDWLNKAAIGAVCRSCGFVHEFVDSGKMEWRNPGDPARPWMSDDGR